MGIGASVGKGGVNALADVLVVQHLLNAWRSGKGLPPIASDGDAGAQTLAAIERFQAEAMRAAQPDGRIDPGGRTWQALATAAQAAPPPAPLSGADWWQANQAKYPNSRRIADLAPGFRAKASAFLDALSDAGARVSIAATRRNAVRAQLMHYSWQVATGALRAAQVPAIPGAAIRWDHGDDRASRRAAQAMVDLFGIAYEPALTSLHIQGRAIDMTIGWSGTLDIRDKAAKRHRLTTPRSGDANTDLHAVGASYGVYKLPSDPPHWSETGR